MIKRLPFLAHHRYALKLGLVFLLVWVILAINPSHRQDWALENLLVLIFGAILILTVRSLPLSRILYTLILIFLTLHEIGAYNTYAEVPYDRWFESLTGGSFNTLIVW